MSGDLYFGFCRNPSSSRGPLPTYDLREVERRLPSERGERTVHIHEVVRTYHDSYIAAVTVGEPIAYRWAHVHESLPSWMVKCLIMLQNGQTVVRYILADDLDCDDMISYECE